MSKSRRVSRKPIYILLALSLVLSIGYTIWRTYLRPTPITIMAIAPAALTYGDTTISGTLQKDSPVGQPGTYLIVLPDMRTVILYNVQGIDGLVGLSVSASGLLAPPPSDIAPMSMTVRSITVAQ